MNREQIHSEALRRVGNGQKGAAFELGAVERIIKDKVGYHLQQDETRMHYARLCEIEPIPITEEILIKCGFEKSQFSNKIYAIETNDVCVVYYCEGNMLDVRTHCDRASIEVRTLHQLQNVYQLVTGKELEIKL